MFMSEWVSWPLSCLYTFFWAPSVNMYFNIKEEK